MKKVLLTLLSVIVVLGLFAATGYAGYRFGFLRGAQTQITANGTNATPQLRPFDGLDRGRMPMHDFGFGRGFQRGLGGFPMMGMGFGIFSLFGFLLRIAVFALVIWFIYWLFTRSGWRLTRTVTVTEPPAPAPTETTVEVKEE